MAFHRAIDYYLYVLALIRDQGMEAIREENEQLEAVINSGTSSSSMEWAKQRRNIMTSFFNAAADYSIRQSNDGFTPYIASNKVKKFPKAQEL